MTFTYDLSTDIGKLRALLGDTDASADALVFQDEQLALFLELEVGLKRARGRALLVGASDIAMRQRLVQKLGLDVSAADIALQLRLLAKEEYAQAEDDDERADALDGGGLFDIAEVIYDDFGARELRAANALRGWQ